MPQYILAGLYGNQRNSLNSRMVTHNLKTRNMRPPLMIMNMINFQNINICCGSAEPVPLTQILAALLKRYAGVRQLQRLTGIGKNIISNVSKTIY